MHSPDTRPFDLVALGEPLLEFNQVQDDPPLYLQGFGGDTSNAVIAAARAGARCAYLSRLGQDHWATLLRQLWAREGVDAQAVLSDAHAPTGIYFVSHDKDGHHFSYARAGSAASRMQGLDRLWAERIAASAWLHVSGISMAISSSACQTVMSALKCARQCQTGICIDSNLRLRLWSVEQASQALEKSLPLCDLFLPSLEDMQALTGLQDPQEVIAWSHQRGAGQVVLKLGERGALCSDGQSQHLLPAHRVEAIDATGAGDCFAGNLLARLAQGDGLYEAARYANAAAALSVQGYGAVAALPRPLAVRDLLRRSP